jgi:PhnB protein
MSTTEESEHLFSYGTLQKEAVQLATFGRKLLGEPDTLVGYRQTMIDIQDPSIVATSGAKYYLNAQFTGRDSDFVVGTMFKVTRKELEQADIYEDAADYKRVSIQLKSGTRAWVYCASTQPSNHSNFAPKGWATVTPRIVVDDARQLVEFLRHVFGATGEYRQARPSEIRIGDSIVMISDAGTRNSMTAFLYVYVNDADATYQRAIDAGARSLEEPFDTPYGDRRCMVEDKWGNNWQIATHPGNAISNKATTKH